MQKYANACKIPVTYKDPRGCLKGCYEGQDVLDLEVTSNLTLSRASVGLCQENCGLQNFALQVDTKYIFFYDKKQNKNYAKFQQIFIM